MKQQDMTLILLGTLPCICLMHVSAIETFEIRGFEWASNWVGKTSFSLWWAFSGKAVCTSLTMNSG